MKNVREAASWLGLSVASVYALCSSQVLKHYRIGMRRGKILFEEADLEAFKISCRVAKDPRPASRPAVVKRRTELRHLRLKPS